MENSNSGSGTQVFSLGSELRRLSSVPRKRRQDPVFTREQQLFLQEALVLIGAAVALAVLFLKPGVSRAAADERFLVGDRILMIHEMRAEEERAVAANAVQNQQASETASTNPSLAVTRIDRTD